MELIKQQKIFKFYLFILLFQILEWTGPVWAQENCENIFSSWQQKIEAVIEQLKSHPAIVGKQHPFEEGLNDLNQLAISIQVFQIDFPEYANVMKLFHLRLDGASSISKSSFEDLAEKVFQALSQKNLLIQKEQKPNLVFAALATLETLLIMEGFIQKISLDPLKFESPPKDKNSYLRKSPPVPSEDSYVPSDHNSLYFTNNGDVTEGEGAKRLPFYGIGIAAPLLRRFVITTRFENINPDGSLSVNYSLRPPPTRFLGEVEPSRSSYPMFVLNKNQSHRLILGHPYKFAPMTGSYNKDYRVVEKTPEEFMVESTSGQPLPEKVKIWLKPHYQVPLSHLQLLALTAKSGIPEKSWPQHVLHAIQKSLEILKSNPKKAVAYLENWFQMEGPYLYNSSSGDYSEAFEKNQIELESLLSQGDPYALALTKIKMFKCDGAALIGATLIRDFLRLPTRIGQLYTVDGSEIREGVAYNLVNLNKVGHQWIEVYLNHEWIPFDFTPQKNAPRNESQESLEEKNSLAPPFESLSEEKPQATPETLSEEPLLDSPASTEVGAIIKWSKDPFLNQIQSDILSVKSIFFKVLMTSLLEDHLQIISRSQLTPKLNEILAQIFKDLSDEDNGLQKHLDKVTSWIRQYLEKSYGLPDGSIQDLLSLAKSEIYLFPEKSYRILQSILAYYNLLSCFRSLSEEEKAFIQTLNQTSENFIVYSDPNAIKIDFINRFFESISPSNSSNSLLEKMILNLFPKAKIAGHADQNNFFEQITQGRFKAAMRVGLLNKIFDHFLVADKVYRLKEVKSGLPSRIPRPHMRDLVPATLKDIMHLQNWLLEPTMSPDPLQDLLRKVTAGEQRMRGFRKPIRIPGTQFALYRRLRAIYYDISSSMSGPKAKIQASAVATIINKEMSEKDDFGKPLNVVILVPFGDNVGDPRLVQTEEEALLAIEDFLNSDTPATQGTHFQPCFDHFFELVAAFSQISPGEDNDYFSHLKFTKFNMDLITDEESAEFDIPTILKKINAFKSLNIDIKCNLTTLGNFINRQLRALMKATNAEKEGMHTMVTPISEYDMHRFIKESESPSFDLKTFILDSKRSSLPAFLTNQVARLVLPKREFYFNSSSDQRLRDLISQVQRDPNRSPTNPVEILNLENLVEKMKNGYLSDPMKKLFVFLILENYDLIFQNKLIRLSDWEFLTIRSTLEMLKKQ